MKTDLKITKNFTLEELTYSASYPKIPNVPSEWNLIRLATFAVEVLQPLRERMGSAILINSGYRCKELNKRVGGAEYSKHLYGQAADIYCPTTEYARKIMDALKDNPKVDLAMIEKRIKTQSLWVHVQTSDKPRGIFVETIKKIKD